MTILTFLSNCGETSATTGTGDITLSDTAINRRQVLPAALDGLLVPYLIEDGGGTLWEEGVGIYTDTTKKIARLAGNVTDGSSGAGTLITLTGNTHKVTLTVSADWFQKIENAHLEYTTASVVGSNVTAAVGEFYDLTLAGMTADRLLVLPDTAAVGDHVAWFTNDGDATYVLKLATAAAGSLFEGVDISAGSARYRYFIAGESGHVVCVKAGGAGDTDWRFVPGGDGRIAQSCMLRLLTTTTDTPVTTATWIKVVSSSTNYTEVWDNANLGDVTNDEIDERRAGIYFVVGSVDLPGLADRARVVHRLDLDGARVICNWDAATSSSAAAAFVSGSAGFVDVTAAAGGSISQQIWQSH